MFGLQQHWDFEAGLSKNGLLSGASTLEAANAAIATRRFDSVGQQMQKAAPHVPGVNFYGPTVARGQIDLVPTANANADRLSWWLFLAFGTRLESNYEPVCQNSGLLEPGTRR